MLAGEKFRSKVVFQLGPGDDVQEGGAQCAGRVTVEDRASLKGAAKHGMALSVIMLNDVVNLRLCRCILSGALLVKAWHSECTRQLRSHEDSFLWLKGQILNGEFFAVMCGIWKQFECPVAMEKCMFACTPSDVKASEPGTYIVDDEVAEYYGGYSQCLIAARYRRCLYLWGHPHFAIYSLHTDQNVVTEKFHLFKTDFAAFQDLIALDRKTAPQERMLRIVFFCLCVIV